LTVKEESMDHFTVGDMRRQLEGLPDEMKLTFHAGLTFYRLKRWADDEMNREFGEIEADLSPSFRAKHPDILVAFVRPERDGEPVQVVSVPRL
jgi:hypothetical protein